MKALLDPCARDGTAIDWWGVKCTGCTGWYDSPAGPVTCTCDCHNGATRAGTVHTVSTPESVGAQIRSLLLSIHAEGHTAEDERGGNMSYDTDKLRRQALDHAGICWAAKGEMAPACGCLWPRDGVGHRP